MICPFHYVQKILSVAISCCYGEILEDYALDCILTRNKDAQKKGDFSSPVAFSLGKILKKNPKILSQELMDHFQKNPNSIVPRVESVEGYLNFWLSPQYWINFLPLILQSMDSKDLNFSTHQDLLGKHCVQRLPQKKGFGYSKVGEGKKVNIEYVSANPTGPLHGAHGRGAVFGDVLANLFESQGYDVDREYFINDAGQQIKVLGDTLMIHWETLDTPEEPLIPSGLYPGSYVRDIAQDYKNTHGQQEFCREDMEHFAVQWLMEDIKKDLKSLGIAHNIFLSEKSLQDSGKIRDAVEVLKKAGYVYEGFLETPEYEGKKVQCSQDNEAEKKEQPLLLFRSSDFGDIHDRALKNKDGHWTYFAGDIAYHWDKITRGYDLIMDVWGADHGGHVASVRAAIEAMKTANDLKKDIYFNVELYQMVHFYKNGQAVKMSKRAGNVLALSQILSDIPSDVLRFMMVQKKSDTHLTLTYEDMLLQGKENPVFYIHYAHARSLSVLRNALSVFPPEHLYPDHLSTINFQNLLHHEGILSLISLMASWPKTLAMALKNRHPHVICHYAYDLAQGFHQLWTEGNQEDSLRFLQPQNPELSLCYMAFLQSFVHVLRTAMGILGIGLKEEMR